MTPIKLILHLFHIKCHFKFLNLFYYKRRFTFLMKMLNKISVFTLSFNSLINKIKQNNVLNNGKTEKNINFLNLCAKTLKDSYYKKERVFILL